jgi:hypothetical protein
MATENNTEGFSPLDNLGAGYGDLNLPNTPQSMLPFGGDRIQMPEINFPKADSFTPVLPQFDKLNQEQLNVKQNVVGNVPGKPGPPKSASTKDILSGFGDYIHGSIKAAQDKNTYSRIYQYDSSSKGNAYYDRYAALGQKTFDKIGFTPLRDNESNFNAGTTGWDDFQRMVNYSFIPLAGMGLTAGPKSLLNAIGGDFGGDMQEAKAYEEATSMGYSSRGGVGAFFNNALMNFGYTAGIIGEVMAEELVLGALTGLSVGTAAPVAAARTASNLSRIGKGFSQAFYMDRVANVLGKSLTSLKNTDAARSFWKAANTPTGKFWNPLSNTFDAVNNVSKIGKFDNLTGLAKLSKTAGGFYADVRNLNAAFSEGRLEGGLVENNMYDRLYNEYWDKNGRAPSDEEDYKMRKMSKEASTETIGWNTALVYFSNNLTFGNILKPKGGTRRLLAGKTEELMRTAEGRIVAESTKIAGGKAIQAEAKYIQNSWKESIKGFKEAPFEKILGAAGTYTKANFVEGLQENAQETIAQATENYYVDMYNSQAVKSHMFARAAQTNGMRSKFSYYSDAWEEQNPFTDKGFETFATGFVMGIFGGGMNMVPGFVSKSYNKMFKPEEYQKHLDGKHKYGEQLAATLNTQLFKDPIKVFDQRLLNLAIQEQAGKVKATGSRKLTTDVTDDAFTSAVITAMMTNSMGAFKEQIASYKNLTAVEFEDALKLEKGKGEKYLGKIDSVLQRIDEIEADYEENMERYPDPIDLAGYKKGTEAYNKAAIYLSAWRTARNNAIFLGQTNKNAKKRMDEIANTVRSKKPLSKMSDTELMVLFDTDRLTSEIGMLKTEIESSKGLISAAELKSKERVLMAMKDLQDKVEYYYRYDNAELESRISSMREQGAFKNVTEDGVVLDEQEAEERTRDLIRKRLNVKEKNDQNTTRAESDLELAYKEYLKAISNVRKDEYLERNADDAFEYILDRYKLGRESSTLNKYVNLLYNPKEFMDHVERNYAWMSKAYENRKEFYDSLVNQELSDIELNALLNELANKNIYVSADDIYEFRRNNTIPDEFFDDTRKVVIKRGSPEYEQYAMLFMEAVRLKNLNPKARKDSNERLGLELVQLASQEQQELNALPQKEQRKEKGDLDKLGKETVKLSEVVNQLQNGDTLSAFYLVDGQPNELIVYRDGDVIKFNDKNGEVIDVAQLSYDIVDGKIFTIERVPADAIEAQKIKNRYALKREEAIRKAIADVESTPQVKTEEFVPFTVNTPLDQLDRALYTDLQVEFNDFVAETDADGNYVNKDENGVPLVEAYAKLTDEQLLEKFEEYIRTSPEAKKVIENYNAEMQGRKLEEQVINIIPPIIDFNGKEMDMAMYTLDQAKEILADLESQYAIRSQKELTDEEKEDLLIDELNIARLRRYIADVEAYGEQVKVTEKEFSSDAEQLAAETAKRKQLAEMALQRRIDLVEEKRKLVEKEEAEITDTLDYLQQLLDNTVELTGVQVEDLINKIEQLDKTTAQLLKSNQKKRSGKIKERSRLYKQQLRREFAIANDVMNRVRELKQQQEQLGAIKKDLKKQADYYRNLLADPKFDLFTKTDIRNKIQKIEKKMNTIQKLIEFLRTAIAKSSEYLKEYLNIWKKQNTALSKLKKATGYEEVSTSLNELIRATDDISKMKLEGFAEVKRQVNQLERDINNTMDNVEFIDEVREQEQNRMTELEAALQKYQDQLRYLNDLLDPVAKDIIEEPLVSGDIKSPAPTEVRAQTVEEVFAQEEEKTIISTFSLADIADLDQALSEKAGRPLTVQEQRLDSVRSTIREVLKNASFIKLNEDGTKYINTKTGKEYMRVTSYTKEDEIKDPMLATESMEEYRKRLTNLGYSANEINGKLRLASSTILGNYIDEYVRDFFSGKLKESSKYTWAPVEEIEKLKAKLETIKTALDARGEIVLANNVVLYNDELSLAGTVDLLTFDRNGDVRIYDIKTMLGNNFAETYQDDNVVKYESKRFGKSKRQQHTEQLSLYRILLNNTHGLKAKTLAVLPIALDYDAGGNTTRTIDVLSGVEITPQDAVGATAVLVEQQSTKQQVQNSPQATTGIKVVTDIQKELRDQLNLMGYSNTAIDLLPKSEIEYIVKNGIPKEQYANRTVTQAMTDNDGRFWALPGDPIFITAISDKGITVSKSNGKNPIFITFNQLTTQTQMSTGVKPQAPVVQQTEDTTTILQESSDLAKEVIKKEINNVEDRIKDTKLEDLENSLFNAPIC